MNDTKAAMDQPKQTAMLKSYFNKKPDAMDSDTLVCKLCKKDVKAAKGRYSKLVSIKSNLCSFL